MRYFEIVLLLTLMEHSCHKCGQAVEDGVPFCAHCGAPQIRVALAEGPLTAISDIEQISAQDAVGIPGTRAGAPLSLALQWRHALSACAIAALGAALLMTFGLMVPLLAMSGAGFLAIILYRRRAPGSMVRATGGAQIGAVSGVLCFGMTAIFEAVRVAITGSGAQIRNKLLEVIEQTASRTSDPQAQQVFDYFKSPPGMAVMVVFFLFFALLFFVLLGVMGGAIGGAVFGRRGK